MPPASCPGIDALRQLQQGALTGETQKRYQQHLEHCPSCQRLWQQMLTETLQGSGGGQPNPEDTGSGASGPRSSVLAMLSPPQGDGELGWLDIYRIRGVLGAGGMGTVFEAEDTHLHRRVALKVMRPDLAALPASRQRFLQEARSAAQLSSDHIITIYRVGQANDIPFLAMELLQGESLEERVRRLGRLPFGEVVRIGAETARGLAVAHAQGVIHRDIKPANIFLERRPETGGERVKILDFGLAQQVDCDQRLTASGLIVGTPSYLSPEQARGLTVDARSDLFSLGCVLYRLVSGRLPFEGPDTMSILTALAVDDPMPIQRLVPEVPVELAQLVHRLLERNRDLRPQTAEQVALLLGGLGSKPNVTALATMGSTSGASPAPRRWSRRRSLGAGLVALVVLGLAGLFFLLPRGEQAVADAQDPIKVGVLFSLSGPLATDGMGASDAITLAIEELNQEGGLLGRRVEPVVVDAASIHKEYPQLAEKLLVEHRASALFGCWTSVSRKLVLPVVEEHDSLLFCPLQMEGLEESPCVVYLGSTPNQHVIPALKYATGILRRRKLFLVGTDNVYPRVAEALIGDELRGLPEARLVGTAYVPFGSLDMQEVMERVEKCKPDLILNMLYGDSNAAFFRALRKAGVDAERCPTLSFLVSETDLRSLSARHYVGNYLARHYFQSIDRPENHVFVKKFKSRFGEHRVVSGPMEASYVGVQFWAQAVSRARSTECPAVRAALHGLSLAAPSGRFKIDRQNLYAWQTSRLGKISADGQVEIIWSSESALPPRPFPSTRSRAEWDQLLQSLYAGWGNQWEATHP